MNKAELIEELTTKLGTDRRTATDAVEHIVDTIVRAVNKGSAADKAGIKAGDVIVRVDDAKVATPADVSAHLRTLRGRPVSVVVVRDRKEINVMLSVIHRPERSIGALWHPELAGWLVFPGADMTAAVCSLQGCE